MRFFAFATAFMGALSVVAAKAPTSDVEERSLFVRATAGVCVNVPNIVVLGVVATGAICICQSAGALQPDNLVALRTGIITQPGLVTNIAQALGLTTIGVPTNVLAIAITSSVDAAIISAFQNAPQPTCTYPANSIPGCSPANDCSVFTCQGGFVKCGTSCVAGTVCPTPGRKRGLGSLEDIRRDLRCPSGFDACTVATFGQSIAHKGRDFECIQTHRDLESCGGCMFPLAGQSQGIDCTSIAESTSVSCHVGKCVVHSCTSGFAPNGSTCARTGTGRQSKGDGAFWSALEVLVARKQDGQ